MSHKKKESLEDKIVVEGVWSQFRVFSTSSGTLDVTDSCKVGDPTGKKTRNRRPG